MGSIFNNGDSPAGGGDGAALYSMPHPLNITEEMRQAGEKVIRERGADLWPGNLAYFVYEAMANAAPPEPDFEISDDALETVEMEISLAPEAVEELAIRTALGNNGGKWSEHYTDDQKEHWRKWVGDLADAAMSAPRKVRVIPENPDAQAQS